jgi:hypothetical protein
MFLYQGKPHLYQKERANVIDEILNLGFLTQHVITDMNTSGEHKIQACHAIATQILRVLQIPSSPDS